MSPEQDISLYICFVDCIEVGFKGGCNQFNANQRSQLTNASTTWFSFLEILATVNRRYQLKTLLM